MAPPGIFFDLTSLLFPTNPLPVQQVLSINTCWTDLDNYTTLSFNVKWYMKCFMYWTAELKSSELWSSQLWTQFKELRIEAWKSQDFNGVWTCDLAIAVWRSNQLSYEATDVGSWSFVRSNEPVKNGCEVIYEMFHISNCGFEIKWAMIIAVMRSQVQTLLKSWLLQASTCKFA